MREGNILMSLVTGSLLLFVVVKVFFVMVILGLYRGIPKTVAPIVPKIGKCIIISLMLLVVGNNLIQIGSAVEFNSFTGTSGTIGNGNGYFDNENTIFNISSSRNIYVVTEPTAITIVEPLGYPLGTSSSLEIMRKGDSNLIFGMVASDGYLYYVDSQGIKKKLSRSTSLNPLANDTLVGGTSVIISSITPAQLVEYQSNIYFFDGTTLKYFDINTLQVSTYITGISAGNSFTIITINNELTIVAGFVTGGNILISNTSSQNIVVYTRGSMGNSFQNPPTYYSSMFSSGNYIYFNYYWSSAYGDPKLTYGETILYYNYSVKYIDNYISSISWDDHVINIGGYSTTVLYASSASKYNVFNFIEPGIFQTTTQNLEPPSITYNIKQISSDYANYYNTSALYITTKIDADSGYNLLGDNYLIELADYRWRIDLVDPNGVVVYPASTPTCVDSWDIINPTGRCLLTQKYRFSAPSAGWMAGTWTLNLYETGLNDHLAYLATNTFNVYNGSINNSGSTISTPEEPITSDSNQEAIGLMDGYVGLMGLGISGVTKFLFSLILVVVFFVAGLLLGKGNAGSAAIALSTIPYTFFTYINYIPKWVFIIYIIMLIMISKVFR